MALIVTTELASLFNVSPLPPPPEKTVWLSKTSIHIKMNIFIFYALCLFQDMKLMSIKLLYQISNCTLSGT